MSRQNACLFGQGWTRELKALIVPGINGSGPEHWQTLWERRDPGFVRVEQSDWDHPDYATWSRTLGVYMSANVGSWIVAHSLGCLLAARFISENKSDIKGLFLVAPPDPHGVNFPQIAESFAEVPVANLGFRGVVVASEDDPYGEIKFTRACAKGWGLDFKCIGKKGHINSASGVGFWQEGYDLFLQASSR